jgi:uncharacterized protein YjcR
MSIVRTNAAAAMLGVSPNTLRSWERRFGYPKPRRTQGGHRQFELVQIEAREIGARVDGAVGHADDSRYARVPCRPRRAVAGGRS